MTKTSTPSSALADELEAEARILLEEGDEFPTWRTTLLAAAKALRTLPTEPTEGLATARETQLAALVREMACVMVENGGDVVPALKEASERALEALRQPTAQTNEVLREALEPVLRGIEQSEVHMVMGEPMKRILIAKTAEDRIRAALTTTTPGDAA